LEELFTYFDENQKSFSSIEKFRNQVIRGQLRWGPCHTEKFWQENAVLFDTADNLSLMKQVINKCLANGVSDKVKAVACFDIGEFARFFPQGKAILDQEGVRSKMTAIMADQTASAELKKEAITCYQKMLMNSWSSSDFKS